MGTTDNEGKVVHNSRSLRSDPLMKAQFRRRTLAASNVIARWIQRLRKRQKLLFMTSSRLLCIRRQH